MNVPFYSGSLLASRASFLSLNQTLKPRFWCNARVFRPASCQVGTVPRAFSIFRYSATTITTPISPLRSHTPPASVLQFIANKVWDATHRSRISRASFNSSRTPREPYNPQRPPNSLWQRIRERIDALPNTVVFWGVLVLNGLVFVMWNVAFAKYKSTGDPSMYLWMRNNFTASIQNVSAGRIWTLLTSCISHEGTAHVAMNAFTFYFMAPAVMSMLGNTAFLSLYLGGGLAASLGSLWWHNSVKKQPQYASHGASGAIYAVISFLACVMPKAQFYLFAVLPIPAWAFVGGVFLFDGYSALHDQRGSTDTAGHVGGLLAGIGYYLRLRFRWF